QRLEAELDALSQDVSRLERDALEAQKARAGTRRALPWTNAGEPAWGPAVGLVDETAVPQDLPEGEREQLDEFVSLVGDMVKQKGNGAKGRGGGFKAAPINGSVATLQGRWSQFLSRMSVDGWMDVNQLIQWVMREAYVNNTEDLKIYAQRVKYFTDLRRVLRTEISRARKFQSDHRQGHGGDASLDAPFDRKRFDTEPRVTADGAWQVREPQPDGEVTDGKAVEAYIKDLEQLLSGVGDDAQMAQLELQNMSQRQQQVMQMLSNLSKVLHDTSMAIIRKIGS
ncbi:MAG TPA: hypothetical protein VFH51_03760, partial [Myxococcota bacterium]|nr:hypothetical protein [Myxococcota bacterium]